MWSIGVTALLVSSVLLTALIAYMDHFDMPTIEEQAATQDVLQRLTTLDQEREAGLDDGDTRLTMQRSAASTLSGIMSPYREQQGSSHPPQSAGGAQHTPREVALVTQPSRNSAAQVGLQAVRAFPDSTLSHNICCTTHPSAICLNVQPTVAPWVS
jgi:hypothetical protein